jgi:hypothetical protein
MSGALAPLHHASARSRRCCTAGYDIARPVLLSMPQLAGPLGSSSTALVLPTSPILLLGRPDGRTTSSQLVTDTPGAPHKSP